MNIAFFSESPMNGRYQRNFQNARTEIAWQIALKADHYDIFRPNKGQIYDLGIIILPKKNISKLMSSDFMQSIKPMCKNLAIMQEGPHTYFQDYPIDEQIWYYNVLRSVDIIFCHNQIDKKYYDGLLGVDSIVMPSLMIEDTLTNVNFDVNKRHNVMVGGNMVSWYGGFDSTIVAYEFDEEIHIPSMGRRVPNEEALGVKHLPYMSWTEWIYTLANYKYGVHLMRTHAAGTFALNCSFLGIPCIGYSGLDTQQLLHPYTTVDVGDITSAKKIAAKLKTDKDFYSKCSKHTRDTYRLLYSEDEYISYVTNEIEKRI